MSSADHHDTFRLDPISGPEVSLPAVPVGGFATLGRAAECELCLLHETVSRRHATVASRAGRWFLTDLASRHGTFVNGVKLDPNAPAALLPDDLIRIGPWTFRAQIGTPRNRPSATLSGPSDTTQRVERVPERELGFVAQQRLNLLVECSAAINAAASEDALISAALDAALAGSGYRRVAWLRPAHDGVERLGFKSATNEPPDRFAFSQSLIREAAAGQTARLTENGPINYGQSIASLGIHSALCAPIVVGAGVMGYLYFDARGQESPVHPEAAGFCQAIARMCGLAMANLKRVDLEHRQRRIDSELAAAREAQQLIMPPAEGQVGGVRFAIRGRPGRTVAGDLFDMVELEGGRVAVFIGDVTGESISAGIIMATTQAYLHASLLRHADPALALQEVNRYLTSRCALNMYVTMWAGVIDPAAGLVRFIDAGHGHWLLKRAGSAPEQIKSPGGIPVAIEPNYPYINDELRIAPGDRIFLYSDGLSEQRSPAGEEFGKDRVVASLASTSSVHEDADALFSAVQKFAQTDMLDDDATAASIELRPPQRA